MAKEIEIPEGNEARIEGNKVIIELTESEDERIRKTLISVIKEIKSQHFVDYLYNLIRIEPWDEYIAYLEKQKDASKAIEAVERIDKYIDEHTANAHDMKDSNPDKKYYSGVDDTLSNIAGILIDVYSEGKQKEPHYTKRNALFDKCVENCDPEVMKSVSDKIDEMLEKEQKPAEWSEEDDALLKEIVSFFKDGTVKLQHDLDLYAGFLENKFKSLRLQPKQGWSDKDEKMLKETLAFIETIEDMNKVKDGFGDLKIWLKSLRPSWKPSKEQMEELYKYAPNAILYSLYSDLKKLCE